MVKVSRENASEFAKNTRGFMLRNCHPGNRRNARRAFRDMVEAGFDPGVFLDVKVFEVDYRDGTLDMTVAYLLLPEKRGVVITYGHGGNKLANMLEVSSDAPSEVIENPTADQIAEMFEWLETGATDVG